MVNDLEAHGIEAELERVQRVAPGGVVVLHHFFGHRFFLSVNIQCLGDARLDLFLHLVNITGDVRDLRVGEEINGVLIFLCT